MAKFDMTPEQAEALRIAHAMVDAGVPVFAAAPCPDDCPTPGHGPRNEYHLPRAWQKIGPSHAQVDRWRPGWGLAAVGGSSVDVLDEDPRSGGEGSVLELKTGGIWPRVFGIVRTKSAGRHYYISALKMRETNGFMPGLDYQGGDEDGEGRAFAWLPPTVGRSKDPESLGELRAYEWQSEIDLDALKDWDGADDSGENLKPIIAERRKSLGVSKPKESESVPEKTKPVDSDDPFVRTSQLSGAGIGYGGKAREFTQGAAESFVLPSLLALREAKIGEIEERANRAAVMLSHFVPQFWTPEQAYAILVDNLSHTAYDPSHPASSWTAEKFKPVLDGTRPPRDPWKATKLPESVPDNLAAPVEESESDAVDALLAEMLTFDQIMEKTPPEHLIKGLLLLDSEAWIIGAPGSKKSFVVLDMAARVALGLPWRGRKVNQGNVVFIAAEGAGGLTHRAKAWIQHNGLNPMEGVRVLPRPVQAADKKAWGVLVEACRRLQPSLVVVDTQARSTVGLEENSATDMGHYVEAVSAIRQVTGACVLSVHHTGRGGGDARGSSAIDGAQYTELKVECEAGKMSGRLLTEKQKDIEQAEPVALNFSRIVVGKDEDGDDITSLVLTDSDAYEEASAVEERQPETVRDAIGAPEEWIFKVAPSSVERQRLLQVVLELGQEDGLTKAEAFRSVAARWYDGKIATNARDAGVSREVLRKAWSYFLSDRSTEFGEPVLIRERGEKARVNEFVIQELERREAASVRPEAPAEVGQGGAEAASED